jgi:hypothetical protein
MCCLNNYLIVGDSNGWIHAYVLPRLWHVVSTNAHEIVQPHVISSMALDEGNSVLYTGDTFGYVKKWQVIQNPRFALESVKIARLHHDEISGLTLLSNGHCLATCGTERRVRLWSADFRYIGFFGSDKRWNIHDVATWSTDETPEIDPEHFRSAIPKGRSAGSRRLSIMGAVSTKPRPLETKSSLKVSEVAADDEQKPFDLQDARQIIDDYVQTWPACMKTYRMEDPIEPEVPRTEPAMGLQGTIHPNELITSLIQRPLTSFDPSQPDRLLNMKNSLVKQKPGVARPGGPKPKEATRRLDRVPLTLTFY